MANIKDFKLGGTGKFPRGKAHSTDEGELRMAIAADPLQGIVRIEFGKPIAWLGLPPKEAKELGYALIEKAAEVLKRQI